MTHLAFVHESTGWTRSPSGENDGHWMSLRRLLSVRSSTAGSGAGSFGSVVVFFGRVCRCRVSPPAAPPLATPAAAATPLPAVLQWGLESGPTATTAAANVSKSVMLGSS